MSRSSIQHVAALLSIAVLALAWSASPVRAQYFGKNKVQYEDFDWKIYHAPHFDVYYYTEQEELLQKVVSFAESAYDELSQEFDYQIQKPTPLIFYETHSHFEQNNVISNFIPEGVGAFASSVRNRMFLPVDLPDPELMSLILHELTHIFQYHILFGGSLGKGVAAGAPQWFMEGMASFMEGEESARDKMFVRDAVVNDRIPRVTQTGVEGFFAYRFGYSVFEYIVERWGEQGFRDFLIEIRNTLGARVGKAVERTFQMDPEDFDADFRRWLRRRYLAELLETGEPSDFGRPFRVPFVSGNQEVSPVASPGGDLIAAFSTAKADVDVVLFDAKNRVFLRNLTSGYSGEYQYLVAQELTMGRKMGRDMAFSPDGNQVAFFARKNRGRHLVMANVLKGGIDRSIPMEVEQQFSPTWSPDGRRIAFSGWSQGRFDIFEIDLESGVITNLTDDDIYDASPAYSPDGGSMLLTSVVGGYAKIFRIELDNPSERIPLREGLRSKTNEMDAVYSPDGRRVYFTSDGTGANNIFSFELESGVVRQHTNAVTGTFTPTVLQGPDGKDRLVFTAFWKGQFKLYLLDVESPISEPVVVSEEAIAEAESVRAEDLPRFEPSIEVTLDDENKEKHGGFKFFLESVTGGTIGISDDQTFIAAIGLQFSDFLGDRKIIGWFESIESFQNFNVFYVDQRNRLQWQVHLFDDRDFFVSINPETGRLDRRNALSQTGAIASLIYPFGVNHRVEFGGGYQVRDLDFVIFLTDENGNLVFDPETGDLIPIITPRKDDYPVLQAALVGDSAVFSPWGGVSGRRWRLFGSYAPNLDESGTLTSTYGIDARQYVTLTRRSNFALRLYGAASDGDSPTPLYIGGLDTIRGFRFRSLVGDRVFYSNIEFRFPLIDILATPLLNFQGIRGVVFLDVGGAWYSPFQGFRFWNGEENRLEDGVSSYGFGLTARLFGLSLNWDFSKRWDFDQTLSNSFRTSFWIGTRF